MNGTNSTNGKPIDGIEHLRQSIADILSTPIGTRVMMRDYGSSIFSLIDAPLNRSTILSIYAATADAIRQWEPRILVKKVKIASAEPGAITLDLFGTLLANGKPITIDGISITTK